MKIDKLYTLSQFVDLQKDIKDTTEETYTKFVAKKLGLIIRYNEFLKQPLKKEMFVNELKYPVQSDECYKRKKHLNYDLWKKDETAWMEAKKKVIFNDIEILSDVHADNLIIGDKYQILIFKSGKVHLNYINELKADTKYPKTLYELAEEISRKSNGQLELKNIEL